MILKGNATNKIQTIKIIQMDLKLIGEFKNLKNFDQFDRIEHTGDVYQVNLSQKFTMNVSGYNSDPFEIYDLLKNNSPSPFGCYLDGGAFKIISSSPERFLRLKENVLQTRERNIHSYCILNT